MTADKKIRRKPSNKFRILLVILAGALLFIIALLISAFQMLKLAQDYGILEVPEESIVTEGWNDIDKDTMDMINSQNQPMSAIESIQMENFMDEN